MLAWNSHSWDFCSFSLFSIKWFVPVLQHSGHQPYPYFSHLFHLEILNLINELCLGVRILFFVIANACIKLFGNFLASKVFWYVWIRLSFAFSGAGALVEAELHHPADSLHNVYYVLHCVMEEKSCHYSLQIINPSSAQRETIWKANSSLSSIISGCFFNILDNLGLKAPVFSARSTRHWGVTGWSPGTGIPSCWVISLAIINSHCLSAIWLYTAFSVGETENLFLDQWQQWCLYMQTDKASHLCSQPSNTYKRRKGLDTNQ